jgi:hypothetical protein
MRKETYTEQVLRECREDDIKIYFLVSFIPALLGYGVGKELIMAFTDNVWANVLTPFVFAIIFALVALFIFYICVNHRGKSR